MLPIPDISFPNNAESKTLASFIEQMNANEAVYKQARSYFGLNSDQSANRKLIALLLGYQFDKASTGKYRYLSPPDEKEFFKIVDEQCSLLRCISTCQGLSLAFHLKTIRYQKAVEQALKVGCNRIAEKLLSEEIPYPTRSWLNSFAKLHHYNVYSGRTLEDIRRKSIDKDAVTDFFNHFSDLLEETDPHLLFNADESILNSNRVYKVLGKDRKTAIREKRSLKTHITGMFAFNAAGHVLPPYIILQNLVNLPDDLKIYQDHAVFASSSTGWMNRSLFYGFSVFFSNFISHYRLNLPINLRNKQIVLTVDGHNSRTSLLALKFLKQNNIALLVLPAHMSHIVQAFDVALAGTLKTEFEKQLQLFQFKDIIFNNNQNTNATGAARHMLVAGIINAWIRTATPDRCIDAFKHSGIKPPNANKVLESPFYSEAAARIYRPTQRNIFSINNKILTTDENIQKVADEYNNGQIPILRAEYFFQELYWNTSTIKGKLLSPIPSLLYLNDEGQLQEAFARFS